jgi:glyoxalase family protein
MPELIGLHHVTAIAGDAQQNLDFYAGVLGLRLVKKTVNQDAPDTYHLFYADAEGHPGTDLTFFPWPGMGPGRPGPGLASEVSLAVPSGSLGWWSERLARYGSTVEPAQRRFGELVLSLADPHGLRLALVETDDAREFAPWEQGPIPVARQVRGLHSLRLQEPQLAASADFLTDTLGFTHAGVEEGWHRFALGGGGSGRFVDLRELPGVRRGAWGVGSVHHLAWRVADEPAQLRVRQQVAEAGRRPTAVIDRFWFKSVYFTEPGGTLFELATEGPGFAVDETPETLGERLVLPPWLEPQRATIEAGLPPLEAPQLTSRDAVSD